MRILGAVEGITDWEWDNLRKKLTEAWKEKRFDVKSLFIYPIFGNWNLEACWCCGGTRIRSCSCPFEKKKGLRFIV